MYSKLRDSNDLTLYSEPSYEHVIQHQPNSDQPSHGMVVDGWMPILQTIPQNCPDGLQYLSTIDKLYVKHQVKILEALLEYKTNKKYIIKNKLGQKVFYAVENSDCCTILCYGTNRPFEMTILDNFKNEVIHLSRPLACGSSLFPCNLEKIEVFSPPGHLVGIVEQNWSFSASIFTIRNAANEEVLKIKGPTFCINSMCGEDVEFNILSKDKTTVVGCVSKKWGDLFLEALVTDVNSFGITFPLDLDVRMKAVMIGACFLINYMFYERC